LGRGLDKPNDLSDLFDVRPIDCSAVTAVPARAAPTPPAADLPSELLAPPGEPPDLAEIRSRRSGFVVTSYSAVKRAQSELGAKVDARTDLGSELGQVRRLAPDELPGGAETGIFLHEILAAIPLAPLALRTPFDAWFASADVQGLVHRLARRHGRPASEVAAKRRSTGSPACREPCARWSSCFRSRRDCIRCCRSLLGRRPCAAGASSAAS